MKANKIFIASSTEGLDIAYAVQENLERDANITVWNQDDFSLTSSVLDELIEKTYEYNYAIFVFTPDDYLVYRNTHQKTVRDNVLFELGLFIGKLGKNRTFIIKPKDVNNLHIPSDLHGIITGVYDSERATKEPMPALGSVCNKIRRELKKNKINNISKEIEFLKAFILIFEPELKLSYPYSKIIGNNYNLLYSLVKKLDENKDWIALLEVKSRLKEYFEYSGLYSDGIKFGKIYVNALERLGKKLDAIWEKVKHIGYLYILSGEHKLAREIIYESIAQLKAMDNTNSVNECLFYCYRYLGVSYHRDRKFGDIHKAKEYFVKAEKYVEFFDKNSIKYKQLIGRLLGNKGNIALSEKKYSEAIEHYENSSTVFHEIEDEEHIGIANLQIAQAIISSNNKLEEAEPFLNNAKIIFIEIGWIEGQARICEQYARLYKTYSFNNPEGIEKQKHYLQIALKYLKESKELYLYVGVEKHIGRIEELEKNVIELFESK